MIHSSTACNTHICALYKYTSFQAVKFRCESPPCLRPSFLALTSKPTPDSPEKRWTDTVIYVYRITMRLKIYRPLEQLVTFMSTRNRTCTATARKQSWVGLWVHLRRRQTLLTTKQKLSVYNVLFTPPLVYVASKNVTLYGSTSSTNISYCIN